MEKFHYIINKMYTKNQKVILAKYLEKGGKSYKSFRK